MFASLAGLAGLAALIALTAALTALACSPLRSFTTASGERINSISIEEHFPLSTDVREVTFEGERLQKAGAAMEKAGVLGMSGTYEASGVIDKSTLVFTVKAAGDRERKLVVKNCAEPHVCAFFADAADTGVVKRVPLSCRDAVPCAKR